MPRPLSLLLPFAALLLPSLAMAENAWLTREVEALRWPDAENVTVKLDSGDQVTVIYRLDDLVRVRKDDRHGWVPQDALSLTNPEPVDATETDAWEIPDMPSLDIPGLGSTSSPSPEPETAPTEPAAQPTEPEPAAE